MCSGAGDQVPLNFCPILVPNTSPFSIRIVLRPALIKVLNRVWEMNDVAAFCACCGAEITLKAEACPVCGTPRHGMLQPEVRAALNVGGEPTEEHVQTDEKLRRRLSCRLR